MKRTQLVLAAFAAGLIGTITGPSRADAPPNRGPRITLDYVEAEVSDVIRALATQSRVSIALNPGIKGKVTVHLLDRSVDDAISMVTNLAGLGARKVNETYIVAPRNEMRQALERIGVSRRVTVAHATGQAAAELAQNAFVDLTARPTGGAVTLIGTQEDIEAAERLIKANDVLPAEIARLTERIEIKNRTAQQIATALPKMVTGLAVEVAGNAVVISGPKPAVEAAKSNIELMDAPGQPNGESRLYRIKYATANALVILLSGAVPEVTVLPGPEVYVPSKPVLNTLTGQFVGGSTSGSGSQGSQSQTQQAAQPQTTPQDTGPANLTNTNGIPLTSFKNALSLMLRGSPAALDEALRVLKVADTPPLQMMIEAKVVDTSPEFTQNLGVEWQWNQFQFFERGNTAGAGTAQPLGFGNYLRSPFNPVATLNAMITSKQAKLLASPQTVVQNDQDAMVFIGDTLRFQSLAQSSPTTGNQFTVVEVPVGIILLVHPRASNDGYVTLRVHPVVSTVTGFSAGLPQTSSREAETVVRVKDGDTLVIAGLMREEEIKQMSKIPLLGDLPLIGQIFKNHSVSRRKSEVMVFLTIKLIPQPNG